LIEGDRLRIEPNLPRPGGRSPLVILFRGDRDTVFTIDADERSYTAIDRAMVERMHTKIDAARAKMKTELEALAPEQRAQVDKLLPARVAAGGESRTAPREALHPRATGRTDTVSGMRCSEFELMRGNEKESELCIAEWAVAGIAKQDLAVYGKLATFQDSMLQGAPFSPEVGSGDAFKILDQLDGVPIRTRSFARGAPTREMRVVKIVKKPIDPASFELPAGYHEKGVPGM
jgi:hypothetical protein